MTKLTVTELMGQNCLNDSDDENDDFEDSIIKDSVLKLTSNSFDNISSDEFVGAKLKIINSASQNEIDSEYKGISVSRKSLSDLDLSSKFSDDDIGSDDNNDDDDDDDAVDDNSKSSLEYDSDDISEFNGSKSDTSFSSSKRKQSNNSEEVILQNSSSTKQLEKDQDIEEFDYDIYSKFSRHNITDDIEKGNAVHQQLSIWETLLECRIKLHKALVASNKLPQTDNYSSFISECSHHNKKKISKTCGDIAMLLQLILTLQKKLMSAFPDFNKTLSKSDNGEDNGNETDNESISSSIASGSSEQMEDENEDSDKGDQNEDDDSLEPPTKIKKLEDYSKDLVDIHQNFLLVRNEAIQKWNDKTRISSGRVKSSNFAAFEQSTLKQIEQILSDHDRLIKRSQTKRSVYKILGKQDDIDGKELQQDKEFDPEIFDDDDFYHKILREFIEQKSADVTSVQQMGKQWSELQKMRSKMKRPIDVKATKGRRLRYITHSKLVNFSAPVPYNSWTDEAEVELFSSLFGESLKK